MLRDKAPVTAQLLEAFLKACDVPEPEAHALLAARDRVEDAYPGGGLYPCAAIDLAHGRLQDERARLRYLGEIVPDNDEEKEEDGDGYEAVLRHRRPDPALMSEDELEALQSAFEARAPQGEDLRARMERMLPPRRDPQ
ncbi:hypothetical protein ACLVWQ_28390 [Streptomyces sp. CWNU-52B]|uniref:hypothetical protein n=1 Tax=unclassified Streptomyces TaxID=2593676 RepID=UPI0039C425EF